MSNEIYNKALDELVSSVKEALVGTQFRSVHLLVKEKADELKRPEPKAGEVWRDVPGFFYWIYEEADGVLWGRLLLESEKTATRPVYDPLDEDSLELVEKIASY